MVDKTRSGSGRRGRAPGRLLAAALCGTGLAASAGGAASIASASASPTRAQASTPVAIGTAAVLPPGAKRLGLVGAAAPIRLTIALKPRNAAELAWLASAVSNPRSPMRGHYLAVNVVHDLVAPARSTVTALARSLTQAGLRVTSVSSDRLVVHVTGSAATVDRALKTSLIQVRTANGGRAFLNATAPELPKSVAGSVQAIFGLDSVPQFAPAGLARLPHQRTQQARVATAAPRVGPVACVQASAGEAFGSWTAPHMAEAYGMTALYAKNDLGQKIGVAVVEFEGNTKHDISVYESCYGAHTAVNYVKVDGGITPGTFQSGEAALDIETIIGLAPDVSEYVYDAPQNGFFDMLHAIAANTSVKVVSMSWGGCEANEGAQTIASEAVELEISAAEGQSWFASSGDSGSTGCLNNVGRPLRVLGVNDPASQPFVTGTGGTSLHSIQPLAAQTVWNDPASGINPPGATGGGISKAWPMPQYQESAPKALGVINQESSRTPCGAKSGECREVPDVSANADPRTGYIIFIGSQGGWLPGIGGTSAAAPSWASLTALTDAYSGCAGKSVGFLNPSLYAIAGGTQYSKAFIDVVKGNNDMLGIPGGLFQAMKGYDMATGLGAPYALSSKGQGLTPLLCAGLKTPSLGMDFVAPASGATSGGTEVDIIGYGFSSSPITGVFFGSHKATDVTVVNDGLIEADSPAGTGSVTVAVHTERASTRAVPGDSFTYG
jgi:subtilase family serine protease